MNRVAFRGGWVADLLLLVAVFVAHVPAAAEAVEKKRRSPQAAPAETAPIVEIIDGTPRPAPGAPRTVTSPPSQAPPARWTPPSPGDRAATSLQTINDHPGMASPLGGDDVLVAGIPTPGLPPLTWLEVTTDGRLFAAFEREGLPGYGIDVYRSTDGGDTWTLWSTFAPGANAFMGDFLVAQGLADRAFVAYTQFSSMSSTYVVHVARAEINTDSPVWTVVMALVAPATNFFGPVAFETDAWGYADYYVYLVASGDDGNGDDIWFTRSLNLGVSFETGYKIADASDGVDFTISQVCAGHNGYVHAVYRTLGTMDGGVYYRRAGTFAGEPWEAPQTLDEVDNGTNSFPLQLAASHTDGHVYALIRELFTAPRCRYSTDHGATWPTASSVATTVGVTGLDLRILPGGPFAVGGSWIDAGTARYELARSTTTNPSDLAVAQNVSLATSTAPSAYSGIAFDPTRGNRIAALWSTTDATTTYFRFDAEWRRDPGYPNTEVGFPIPISGGGQTPPAVAEVDGDPELEIVFGTLNGDIHVLNHDGTYVPGWPVNIGSMPFDAPVAVGDLVGNGIPAVVAGNTIGEVYAFAPDGTLLPGWPFTMDEAANVFVSIGALGPPNPRYAVAVCGHRIRAIRYDGTDVSPLWGTFTDAFTRPAAIGDVDNDGVTEIVTLKGSFLHILNLNDFAAEAFRDFPGEFFSDAPTLADIDGDGTLEIAAPTASGKMFLMNPDGTDFSPAWPITVSAGDPLTAAAFGQILGSFEPEIVFAERTGAVHVRWYDGAEQVDYPVSSGSTFLWMPPMLSPVNIFVSNVNIGTTDGVNGIGQSWRNVLGNVVPGWPRNLPGPVEETFASGDIDNDGRNEIVALGVNFLSVYDVGEPPQSNPLNHWPMYGYDAMRRGCLHCPEILTGVGDTPHAALKTGLEVRPNPFNPATTIDYEVARAGRVSLEIFDVAGQRVATLIGAEHREPGRYSTRYVAATASGVYFARLRSAGGEVTRKIVLLR